MEVKIENGFLVIRAPLQVPQPSGSGKNLVVASSRGNQKTTTELNGKPITIGLNAYIAKS